MKKKLCWVAFCLVTILIMGVSVLADVTASLKVASDSISVVETAHQNACNEAGFSGDGIISVSPSDNMVHFHSDKYMGRDPEERKIYMEVFLKTIKSSSLGAKEKNSIYNFIASQDTEIAQAIKYLTEDTRTDLAHARKWLAPFTGGISTFTGILALGVFLFLGVGLLMDVAYLALPGLQLVLERGDERKRPFGVSAEAWRVNKEIASDYKNTKNEITEYLKKRVPVILVCCICIGYLISGKIYEAFTYLANAFNF